MQHIKVSSNNVTEQQPGTGSENVDLYKHYESPKTMRSPKLKKSLLYLAVLIVVGFATYSLGLQSSRQTAVAQKTASNIYGLLDPSISNPDNQLKIINFDPLRQSILTYLNSLNVSHSFYFEYLPDGITIRSDEDSTSEAASLMKTPLVMDLYKLSEQGKINLNDEQTVEPVDIDPDPTYGNPTHLKVGDRISLQQAAQITLNQSDNTTLNIVKSAILPLVDNTSDSFLSLDLDYTVGGLANNQQITIGARSYSSILTCLYFSCFNTPEDSNQIINFLVGSAEPSRLVSGVPADIKVAHKVGSGGSTSQSDCGIFYYPQKPYLVCLMFFNIPDANNPDPYFQHISKMIYDYISTATQITPSTQVSPQ
jgi:beta-lactamase class A